MDQTLEALVKGVRLKGVREEIAIMQASGRVSPAGFDEVSVIVLSLPPVFFHSSIFWFSLVQVMLLHSGC